MADYKGIKGFKVTSIAGDPTNKVVGDVYYDTTANALKFVGGPSGTWASGGTMPDTKMGGGSAGTQTANLQFGGGTNAPLNGNQVDTTFSYDGTSWTAGGAMGTIRFAMGSFGASNTAAIAVAGSASPGSSSKAETESYNGTSWTEVADLLTARGEGLGAAGIQGAGLVFGGYDRPGTTNVTLTEQWNGTSWTEVNDLNTARQGPGGCGITTAALCIGGDLTPQTAITEQWNGTSWTEVNDLNKARNHAASSGTSTLALFFGGQAPGACAETEQWNGTSWTEVGDLSTGRYLLGGSLAGTALSALAAGGGSSPAGTDATEEWTVSDTTVKTVTVS
jgi:hypothetical protein